MDKSCGAFGSSEIAAGSIKRVIVVICDDFVVAADVTEVIEETLDCTTIAVANICQALTVIAQRSDITAFVVRMAHLALSAEDLLTLSGPAYRPVVLIADAAPKGWAASKDLNRHFVPSLFNSKMLTNTLNAILSTSSRVPPSYR